MKKNVIIFLTLCIFIYFPKPVLAFEFSQSIFKDCDEHWSENNLNTLSAIGIMNGYEGYSNPDSIITRGEFTALLVRAFDMKPVSKEEKFKDIETNHIFFEPITAASDNGIIDGFSDNTFRPDNMITREEIMLIISRLTPPSSDYMTNFSDISVGYTYNAQLGKVCADGIINGYPDNSFRPYGKTTRAEAATIIIKAMKKYLQSEKETAIVSTAHDYIYNHFNLNFENASGSAKKDSQYILHVAKTAESMGYSINNTIDNISFSITQHDGPFSTVSASYNVTHTRNGVIKTYNGKSEIKLLSRVGKTTVYEHTTNIVEPNRINLTWDVSSNTKTEKLPGVNVVSPTCFRVSDEKRANETVHEIKLDDKNSLYYNSWLNDEYVKHSKANNYKIWAMYKTDFKTETASKLLQNNRARKAVSDILTDYILKYDLDGLNIDFENMYPKDKAAYTNHVKEICVIAHYLGLTVSVDISRYEKYSSNWSMCYDRDAISKYADYVMLMAYDQFSSGSKIAGPVASMPWTKDSIIKTLGEVPNTKLVLSMPYYMRLWKIKNGKVISSETLSMEKANKYASSGISMTFDEQYGLCKYFWNDSEYEYVFWMENADTIAQRVSMANEYKLAGTASWRKGFETADVWNRINETLNIS